ncbi:ATP-dependent helicase HrpB [Acetobacter peroxydans]|jgi:ATP-dependent helicase HrpB|uniref:RNA helicase n=3 Tax=Acetobacter peroxydans TaxID=104098 RepID=A0A4Y3TV58_9PROT|nr:ATP-dependent helicase HrpB [Acetobacter peroxydans]MCH4143570.1 ATP-dependent helicase HrpB [Acetobacter peroxydans]MCI1395649.1 ATP-dependent helicase HrpB [Acetobacter peroxydans]MCI1410528.1 ATP-dependent helicase HrpB [Acetobacter peroxydans]MCI1439273.1 ATP-dependent helicase HrpB [Acetobacter peroxydans]MCI1565571.1 ATP-dependent helicase HrpB [Acetobacter peroxydans]
MPTSLPASDPFSIAEGLPVREILPALCVHLAAEPAEGQFASAVVVAPPGAGKTTSIPPVLAAAPWRGENERIIMLEPRRLAARAAAQRIAALRGEQVGAFAGYRTRVDSAVSEHTRIEVLTEGLFLRRLLSDPMLEGVACVILDEIHERSLDADLALAFCLDLQRSLRPDLRLVAMSATAETERLSTLMNAPVFTSSGRMHALTVHHATKDIATLRDIPAATAAGVRRALAETEGDILVFLPGTGEIRRTAQLLADCAVTVLPLHGELHPAEQARVLQPGNAGERRVILATSIAETSLTVPGVRVVVDCGYRRAPRFDPGAGLSRLETLRISKAAARQRTGRAGREAPGTAYCLWTPHTERAMPQHDRPEILEADLSDFVLATSLWAETLGQSDTPLPLPDPPPGAALAAARELLGLLGALDENQSLTPLGRAMAALGTHPRLAAMLLAASTPEEAALAADLAALLEERDPLRPRMAAHGGPPAIPPADISLRLDLIAGGDDPQADRAALARIRQASGRFRARLGLPHGLRAHGDAAALLAAGFVDRIALSRGEIGSFRMANGGNARLRRDDTLATARLLAVAGLHLRTTAEIRLAAPLDPDALPPAVLARTREQVETALDPASGAIMARRRMRIGNLVLRDRTEKVRPEEAATLLLEHARANLMTALDWTGAGGQLQARVELARALATPLPSDMTDWPDFSFPALAESAATWLAPALAGCTTMAGLKALDTAALLRNWLGYAHTAWLDRELPTALPFPGGRAEVDYTQPIPVASARAQVFFGTSTTPLLANGRIPLRLALLSPAGRPQAITADLAGFWQGGWTDMRRDMRGRYPRHEWPENPALAPATKTRRP